MNELSMKLEAPELAAAITQLAAALLDGKALMGIAASHVAKNPADVPAALPSTPTAPVAPTAPAEPAAPVAPVAPPAAPAPTPTAPPVPVASAPAYTLDQISRAGASLLEAGKMDSLLALLGRYGVQAVTQLAPEQYGTFATELRALGAQI